ncbi:MAG: tRNA (adenosine(37)-N6)-threonylcarbamoyltransferase complex transferase subunit TsaD [Saprospiraceae bacterium]|nr:tRNA (adenosine(37)-N6)-threonylcarbamoyltransferase complex transferase subunit TsaD [Saprospiraceae bacterium]
MLRSIILAIESSCDDTSAAIIINGVIKSNIAANQDVHAEYGGVVPELASRQHQQHIIPVVETAIRKAGIHKSDIDAVAVTRGPGLLGSLIVGLSFAKAFASARNIPIIEVNHMQAHVLAHFAEVPQPSFPFLCLTVSGGHTQIVRVDGPLDMTIIGQSIDDAAGEAYDKTGKILGLPYPSGPIIDDYARKGKPRFEFPEPKIDGLDFSFSGLKTSILYFLRDELKKDKDFIKNNMYDICSSVQHRIISILMNKLEKAALETGIKEIAIAGGVSANSELRNQLKAYAQKHGWNHYIPSFQYCTDNAGMIAIAAHFKFLKGIFSDQSITPSPRMSFTPHQ